MPIRFKISDVLGVCINSISLGIIWGLTISGSFSITDGIIYSVFFVPLLALAFWGSIKSWGVRLKRMFFQEKKLLKP